MASPALQDISHFMDRIDAADAAIESARQQILSEVASFAGHFEHGPWEEEIAEIHMDAAVHDIEAAANEAVEALQTQFVAAIDAARGIAEQAEQAMAHATETWTGGQHAAEQAAQSLASSLAADAQRIQSALQQLGTHYQSADQAWERAQQAIDELLKHFAGETEGPFTDTLHQAVDAFVTDLAGPQAQAVDQHLAGARQTAEQALDELSHAADQLLDQFKQGVDDALQKLADHVSHEIQTKLEQALHRIIEAAVQKILETILEAVAGAEIGVAITSAMSPVLPELIVLKKLTDAILAAIELWHETVGRLRSLGDFF